MLSSGSGDQFRSTTNLRYAKR